MDQTHAIWHGSFQLSNNSIQSNINTTSASTSFKSSLSDRNNVIDQNREYMNQAGCTNTGIISNEMSDNVYRELCGFQKANLIDNSDQIVEHKIVVDNDSYTYNNDESEIGNRDDCYQHLQSGASKTTTNFVQIKSEPNICVKSSNHVPCTETEVIGSPRSIENAEVSIKMEPITCDAFDHSCCMPTDTLTHKSGKNSLHVHEQLDRHSSNSTNYAICIKYEPDSGGEGASHTSGSIASQSRSDVNDDQIRDNSHCYDNRNHSNKVLNRVHQQSCEPIKIEISHIAPTSPLHNSGSDKIVEPFYHDDSYEQLHSSQKNVNIQEAKQPGEKPLTPTQKYREKKYKCDVCSHSTISSSLLKRHKMQHTGERPYKCDMCSYSTTTMSYLKRHKMQHTGEKPYKCDMCSYSSTRSTYLAEHKARHTGEKPYKCDVCSYSTTMKTYLKRHKMQHTGEKPYKCDVCSYMTTRSSLLAEHQARHTGEKSYKCDECSYSTFSSSNLRVHKRIHTGEKPYKCDVCSYSCTSSSNLAEHIKARHKGEKAYTCDMCSYSTRSSSILKRHKAKHTEEIRYTCDVCSYSTIYMSNLKRHKTKHTGETLYKCDVCSYCATESSDLVTHKRKHTGEKQYKCDICNFSTV